MASRMAPVASWWQLRISSSDRLGVPTWLKARPGPCRATSGAVRTPWPPSPLLGRDVWRPHRGQTALDRELETSVAPSKGQRRQQSQICTGDQHVFDKDPWPEVRRGEHRVTQREDRKHRHAGHDRRAGFSEDANETSLGPADGGHPADEQGEDENFQTAMHDQPRRQASVPATRQMKTTVVRSSCEIVASRVRATTVDASRSATFGAVSRVAAENTKPNARVKTVATINENAFLLSDTRGPAQLNEPSLIRPRGGEAAERKYGRESSRDRESFSLVRRRITFRRCSRSAAIWSANRAKGL